MVNGFKMADTSGIVNDMCFGCGTEAVKGNRRILGSSSTNLVASLLNMS